MVSVLAWPEHGSHFAKFSIAEVFKNTRKRRCGENIWQLLEEGRDKEKRWAFFRVVLAYFSDSIEQTAACDIWQVYFIESCLCLTMTVWPHPAKIQCDEHVHKQSFFFLCDDSKGLVWIPYFPWLLSYWGHNSQHRKTWKYEMSWIKITAKAPNSTTTQALEVVEAAVCRLHTWQQEVLLLTTSQWILLIPRNISLPDPWGTGSATVFCRLVPPAAATLCQAVLAGDIFGSYLVLILPWLLWWIIHAISPPRPPLFRQTPFHPSSPRSYLSPFPRTPASFPPESLPLTPPAFSVFIYVCIRQGSSWLSKGLF